MKRTLYIPMICAMLLSIVLAACVPTATPAPQVIKETVVVEKPVEKVVEKVVTPTPLPPTPVPEKIVITVWDWKSGDPASAPYFEKAAAAFMQMHPNVTINHVPQPHTEYYTILGTAIAAQSGPDLVLFHPKSAILDRKDALIPLNDYVADIHDQLTGWESFSDDDGTIYAIPITTQGLVIYYNKAIYREAGLDPEKPPVTWDDMVQTCDVIKEKTGKYCFTFGDKEGWNADWWLTVIMNGLVTDEEFEKWARREMKWTDPKPVKVLELLQEAAQRGWFPEGAASIAMFPDSFEIFERGDAAHVIGLISDVAHWKEFGDFIGDKNLGVMKGLIIDQQAVPSVEAMHIQGASGIGYAVTKWSPNKEIAIEYAKFLANKENLQNFFLYAGAMVPRKDFDKALMPSEAGKIILDWVACCGRLGAHDFPPTAAIQEHERQGQLLLTGATTPAEAAAAIQKVEDEAKK